jgi:hypothetical protein
VPWKNGGGVTRELLAWPGDGDWRVRISVAEIEADGPFSSFPGVDRWFAVLAGGGVALTIAGREQVRRAGDPPLAFSGDAPVGCRLLQGPSRDLNLMLRGVAGTMRPAVGGEAWDAAGASLRFLCAGRRPLPRRRGGNGAAGRHPRLVRSGAGLAHLPSRRRRHPARCRLVAGRRRGGAHA